MYLGLGACATLPRVTTANAKPVVVVHSLHKTTKGVAPRYIQNTAIRCCVRDFDWKRSRMISAVSLIEKLVIDAVTAQILGHLDVVLPKHTC